MLLIDPIIPKVYLFGAFEIVVKCGIAQGFAPGIEDLSGYVYVYPFPVKL